MEDASAEGTGETIPDERLKLLFICAHPAIDPAARTPLMLQTVLGLDAARIASAFLIAPAAMSQRLVRSKAKIRVAGIAFEVPDAHELTGRLDAVIETIYAAYGTGWQDASGSDPQIHGLTAEAIWLARVLIGLLPGEPEPRGLLSLMLHCEARRPARRSASGEYVPLSEQNTALWSRAMLEEAERELITSSTFGSSGRFQLEAAIQSVHSRRLLTGRTEWNVIVKLYDELIRRAPTAGARVSRAAAIAEAGSPDAALRALDEIPADAVASYQSYWAVRAHLLARLRMHPESLDAYSRAIGLSEDEAVRNFLVKRSKS